MERFINVTVKRIKEMKNICYYMFLMLHDIIMNQ